MIHKIENTKFVKTEECEYGCHEYGDTLAICSCGVHVKMVEHEYEHREFAEAIALLQHRIDMLEEKQSEARKPQ